MLARVQRCQALQLRDARAMKRSPIDAFKQQGRPLTDATRAQCQQLGWTAVAGNSTSFAYGADSNLTSEGFPTSNSGNSGVAYTYDHDDQVTDTTMNDSAIWTTSPYTYDEASLTRNADEQIGSTQAGSSSPIDYSYDPDSRLTSGIGSNYTYDAASRLTSQTTSSGPPNLTYDSDNELCASDTSSPSCSSPASTTTIYGYTTAGERCFSSVDPSTSDSGTSPPTSSGTSIYQWDQAGDLTCLSNQNAATNCASPGSSNTTTYTYNGAGLRIGEETHTATYVFTWDTLGSTPNLLADGHDYYLYGPGSTPIEQVDESSGASIYLASDTQGVKVTINSDGTEDGSVAYDSYGNPTTGAGTNFGFAGAYTDPNGLIYLINRYYDPSTGQFLSLDPIASVSNQPYGYANENPANEDDTSGLCSVPSGDPEQPFTFTHAGPCTAGENAIINAQAVAICEGTSIYAGEASGGGGIGFQFNVVQGLEGGVNFLRGLGNSVVKSVDFIVHNASLHSLNPSFSVSPCLLLAIPTTPLSSRTSRQVLLAATLQNLVLIPPRSSSTRRPKFSPLTFTFISLRCA